MSSNTRLPILLALVLTLASVHGAQAHEGAAHGTHEPHHGGIVVMYGELHYEVSLVPPGRLRIYLSDAVRQPLRAALISDLTVEIETPRGREQVRMTIGPTGEFWEGRLKGPAGGALVRLAFLYEGKPVIGGVKMP